MEKETRTSIVVCSRNGLRTVERCLDHIRAMEDDGMTEVILVDNGSSDGTYDIMLKYARTAFPRWRVIRELQPGNSAGRNAGVAATEGGLLLFVDDDCYVDKTFVRDWNMAFAQNPRLGFASGRIMPFALEQSLVGCNVSLVSEAYAPRTFLRRGKIQGSNMAFNRLCLNEIGLFDPCFGAGAQFAGEEWDLALRASFAGWEGGYFPAPSVLHDHGRSECSASGRLRYYDFGAGAVYAKHLSTSHAHVAALRLGVDLARHIQCYSAVAALVRGAFEYLRTKAAVGLARLAHPT